MKKIILAGFILMSTMNLLAQDRLFNYTYQSAVLNKGEKEIEVWMSILEGKENYYRQIRNRVEYEVGLGSNLQTAFYVNTYSKTAFDETSGKMITSSPTLSFSNEWKYKFSDATANAIGFAGYLEFTVAANKFETEIKAIFDKRLGRSTHALNLLLEPEYIHTAKNGEEYTEKELKYDVYYGYAYELNKNWNLGIEASYKNVYIKEDDITHSAFFAGPTISYNTKNFWINASVSPQITGNNSGANSNLNLEEYTKLDSRIIFSFSF